jgi:peroxiredoxin
VSRPLEVGAAAPDFDLPGFPGRVRSRDLRGAPLVLEFHRGTW